MTLLAVLFFGAHAWAFPEMTRHGYTQCTACHVAPGGGGTLTQYGRQMSEEVLSTWSLPREGQVLHGALKTDPVDKGIFLGGDIRSVQTHRKNSKVRAGRYFLMQANADLAYQSGIFTAFISVGQIENPTGGRIEGNLESTKYWLMGQLSDGLAVRVGRFAPQFGLNMADHVLVTKQGLGFAPQLQRDTVEASLLLETASLFAAISKSSGGEDAASAHATFNFADRFKVGASGWYGQQLNNIKRIYGLNAILGFTHHFFNMTEIDFVNDEKREGVFAMSRWGYELYKGIVPYAQFQYQHADFSEAGADRHYTLGANVFPRPHFEVSAQWSKVRSPADWSDQAYILTHYYF